MTRRADEASTEKATVEGAKGADPDSTAGRPSSAKITVVTPAFDSAEFLEDSMRSVLGQGYPALEYIVVDGGSTDGTVEIIREHEERLAWWVSEPDEGQTAALNKGLRRATGDLVCWLNSDDFYYPGALAAAAEAYLADPDAPFYFGDGYRVTRSGRKLGGFFPAGQVHFRREALVFGLNCILQPATFVRRAALEQVGYLDESLRYGFDTNLWIELSKIGQPRPIRKHLAASREYGETKTSTGSFRRAEELRQIAERHSDIAATPGSISYYLDTLDRLAKSRPDVFTRDYTRAIEALWWETSKLFARHGAQPNGFPIPGAVELSRADGSAARKPGRARIGIELRQVTRGVSGGIVVVLVGTLQELFRRRPDLDFVVFCTVFNRELLESDAPNVELVTLPLGTFFTELDRVANEREIDVFIRSYPTVEDVAFPLKRQIFVIPDIQHEQHPEFFDSASLGERRRAFHPALEGSGAIMTISDFARGTIEEHAAEGRDVFVASPSLPPEFLEARSEDATEEERALIADVDSFFFFPANLWPHKNHDRLFEGLRRAGARTGLALELVLTGSPRGWPELRERFGDLPIRHLGYVSPALVKLLYERAIALTFFSEYEGFGIPLLEAFSVGTPVVCSNTTSLPEVAGGAALMCDPTDVEAIADLLERVATDDHLRQQLVDRGRKRLAGYSWEAAADALSAGLERVLGRVRLPPLSENPVVSIVTPTFNQGPFIRSTIESVLAQTYENIEYLVVDGGSTDETLDILREYGDRLHWISEPDSGQTEAINKGLRAARGEIFGYLNSDDILLPHAIETVVDYLRGHPECDLVYGDAEFIDEAGRFTEMYPAAEYSFIRLMEDCCICQPAAYWRAAVADVVGPFDEDVHYAMDFDYWIRVDRSGFAIQYLPTTIAQSRRHVGAKTLRARPAIFREIVAVCRRSGGFVSRNYVHGLWHHISFERPYHVARLLRRVPRLRWLLASMHYHWLNRHRYTWSQRFAGSARVTRRFLIRVLLKVPPLLAVLIYLKRSLRGLSKRVRGLFGQSAPALAPLLSGRTRVTGYWPDNWVEERLDVVLDARERQRQLRIVGRPIAGMTVEVLANGGRLGRFELEANRQETVVVQLPPGPQETISFRFSDSMLDGGGRQVSFLLDETNLFREEDIATHV